ncbi:hypothetical protein Bca101_043965 [Brassica carinata]
MCETPAAVIKMQIHYRYSLILVLLFRWCFGANLDGKGYIDMSTVDAQTSLKINQVFKIFFLTVNNSSKKPAEDGRLIILNAGDKALFEESISAFDVLGKNMMNAFYEGLVLADKSGLSSDTLLDILDHGALTNPMFKGKGPSMTKSSYPPMFPLKHQQKDMRLALGDENAVSMPVAAAENEVSYNQRLGSLI